MEEELVRDLSEQDSSSEAAPEQGFESEEEYESPAAPGIDYVGMTIDAGVSPLEMRFEQINHCYRKVPIAYRTHTYVNSVTMGVISPEKYAFAADEDEIGKRLAAWNVIHAIEAVKAMKAAGREIEFVTARCPAKLAAETDMYDWVKGLMQKCKFDTPEKLCLEFSQSLLYEDPEKTRLSMLNMKLLKVRTLMTGAGSAQNPISLLIKVPVDFVLLDPALTALTDNRNKGAAAIALISYLRDLQIDVIGSGVQNDEQISSLNRADCFGYVPSSGYQGSVTHGSLRMTFEEALAQEDV